ncbi:MAG: glycosyl hydrolase family 88 [Bacteroidetes bacterium]|nr:MAG: glycosyl hydrolase family 88 [Bacteroidota bacterium]
MVLTATKNEGKRFVKSLFIMKIRKILYLTLWFASTILSGQNLEKSEVKEVIQQVADRIIEETSYRFINSEDGSVYTNLENVPPDWDVEVESYINDWRYENGVTYIGLREVSNLLGTDKYSNYVNKNFDWVFNNGHLDYFKKIYEAIQIGILTDTKNGESVPAERLVGRVSYHGMFRLDRLDDCGSLGAVLIDNYEEYNSKVYRDYIERAAVYTTNEEHRLLNGTFCRLWPRVNTVWADDLYMSVPFLAKYAQLTNDADILNDAVNQVIQFDNLLWNEKTGLYYHCYFDDTGENGVAHWGRSNGWMLVAQAMLLDILPEDHPKRPDLLKILKKQIKGLVSYQDEQGLWHQLLDKPDSYPETSCTAMFVYGITKAVNEGWIDTDYMQVAEFGWEGLRSMMTTLYDLKNVCVGTGINPSLTYYYNRPTSTNGPHALGALLLAGCEIYKSSKLK